MNPELIIAFTLHTHYEDTALLPEGIAGGIRRGSRSGPLPEYAGELQPGQAGLP